MINCNTYHFIGQDSIDARLVEANEPVETVKLVVSQLTSLENCGLRVKSCQCEVSIILFLSRTLTVVEMSAGSLPALLRAQDAVA